MLDVESHEAAVPTTRRALTVAKRDGRRLAFDESRIHAALAKAFTEVHGELTPVSHRSLRDLVARIDREIAERFTVDVTIDEIQNVIEHVLLDSHEYAVVQASIDYRIQRDLARRKATDINHSIIRLIGKDEEVVNENANKDSDVFNTQRDLTAGAVGKAIGLTMLPPHVANAHQKGDLHYHDLDYHPYAPMTNVRGAARRQRGQARPAARGRRSGRRPVPAGTARPTPAVPRQQQPADHRRPHLPGRRQSTPQSPTPHPRSAPPGEVGGLSRGRGLRADF